jgi:hypothetical protein
VVHNKQQVLFPISLKVVVSNIDILHIYSKVWLFQFTHKVI